MALKNLQFDSVIRGILEADAEDLTALHLQATERMAALGLGADAAKTVRKVAKHGRGPLRGTPKGSANFNGRSIAGWIESVPAADGTPEVADAHAKLVAIHATMASRLA